MSELDSNCDTFELLAAEFMDGCRRGQCPSIDEYARKHPDLAAEIRELFPTIATLENLKGAGTSGSAHGPVAGDLQLERLGDFRIIRELGRGGMGIVYEAEQESLSRRVALKVLPRQLLLDPQQLERFESEARTAAGLHHTNIVPIFGVGQQEGYHFIVMQYIRGVGLDVVLRDLGRMSGNPGVGARTTSFRPPSDQGRTAIDAFSIAQSLARDASRDRPHVDTRSPASAAATTPTRPQAGSSEQPPNNESGSGSPPERKSSSDSTTAPSVDPAHWRGVARLALQVADACAYAHGQGTLHRDIKPGNLLIDADGIVWVADFGLAKALDQDEVTQTCGVVGTLRYMAPEQFKGKADVRSDVYSMGLTLYELATLRPAFVATSHTTMIDAIMHGRPKAPRQLYPTMPRDLETIILKSIAREPEARYASADALAADLRCFLEDRPIEARRATAPERLWRWSRRNPSLAALSGTAVALLIAVAAIATVAYVHTSRANVQVRSALAGEQTQRLKAEATSALAIEALDTIFDQFAPIRTAAASSMTVDGADGAKIEVPIQAVISRESATLLEHMLDFYRRLAAQDDADPAIRLKIAEANRRVGNIHSRLGHFDDARAAYTRAVGVFQQIEADSGTAPATRIELARIHNQLGTTLIAQERVEDSRAFFREAREILEALQSTSSNSPAVRFELARTCYLLARAPRPPIPTPQRREPGMGQPSDGMAPPPPGARQQPGRDHRPPRRDHRPPGQDHRPAGGPPPDDVRPPPSGAHGPPGRDHRPPGGPPPQREHLDEGDDPWGKAVEILTELRAAYPDVPDYRHLLALCYRDLPPSVPWAPDDHPLPHDAATQAINILQQLVEDFPDVPKYQYDLSETYALTADYAPSIGPDALQQQRLRAALDISEQLVADHPNVPAYVVSQVHIRLRFAGAQRRERQFGAAEEHLQEARAFQAGLARRFPDTPSHQVFVAAIEGDLARLARDCGRLDDARSHLEAGLAVLHELPDDWRRPPYVRDVFVVIYSDLAGVHRQLGDDSAAADAARQAECHRAER